MSNTTFAKNYGNKENEDWQNKFFSKLIESQTLL
jgi:hypothetical protein